MVTRLKITLEQNEFNGLLQLSRREIRNPADQVRFLLRQYLQQQFLLPVEKSCDNKSSSEISEPKLSEDRKEVKR